VEKKGLESLQGHRPEMVDTVSTNREITLRTNRVHHFWPVT